MEADAERPGPGLSISTGQINGTFRIELAGELDLNTRDDFERALASAEASDAGAIVVDVDGLEFIDSTGLQAIVAASRRSQQGDRRLRLTRGTGFVADMFRLTALDQTLPFV